MALEDVTLQRGPADRVRPAGVVVGRYFNESRPHQGIEQRVPAGSMTVTDPSKPVAVTSVLGGLHVDYRRTA